MDCKSKGVVNTTYIIEGVESACNGFSTNIILSCSGNTSINLSTDELIFNGSIIPLIDNTFVIGSESNRFNNINTISGVSDYWVSNIGITTNNLIISGSGIYNGFAIGDDDNEIINWSSLTAYTTTADKYVTGGTYDNNTALITFVGANNFEAFSVDLSSIDVNDTFVTGGTISYDNNDLNGTLILNRNDGNSIIISGFTDTNTTGATLINNIVYFDTNESLSAYTLDLSSLDVNDTYSTGGTVTQFATGNNNEQIIQITGNDGFISYDITGLTDTFITGFTFTPNTLTISQNNGIDLSTNIDSIDLSGVLSGITFDINTTGNITATIFSGVTFYGDGSNLSNINDYYVTGGTISYDNNDLNGTLILNRNDGNSIIISGFTDVQTTGATLINNIVYFNTNESLSAYTLDLSSLDVNDTYSTGGTVTQFANNNSNEQIIQITGNDGFAPYNITGLTDTFITGFTFTPDTLTISQNNGIDLSTNIDNFYVTGGTYNSLTESIDFVGNNPVTTFNVDVSALLDDTNTFTTGATLSGNTILFDRNDLNNAYSVDLTPILPEIPTNLTFFSTTANSDVVGYSKLVISLDDPDYNTIPVNVSTGPITTQGQLIASLVSDAGIFAGNPGVIDITTIGEIRRTSGSGVAEFYYEVYQRNNLGVETLIAISNNTTPVTTSVYQQFQASALFNNGTWLSTDRVVIKYYGQRIPSGSNPTYEFLFGGTNPVRTLFPISAQLLLNVPITIGITGVVSGTTNYLLSVDGNGKLGQINPNIFTDNNISGGTVSYDSNDLNGTLILNKNDGNSIIISGFTDVQTTGATLVNSIAYFDTNESLSAYTLDLSSLDVNDTFVTGYTYNPNSNTLSILQNEGVPPINVTINSMSGLTINGDFNVTGNTYLNTLSATTIDATMIYSGGTNLSSIISNIDSHVTGITWNPNQLLVSLNNNKPSVGVTIDTFSGLTVTNNLSVLGSVQISGSTSGSTLLNILGTQGQLFSITDDLSGLLFSVNNALGNEILQVYDDNTVLIGDYNSPSLYTTNKITAYTGNNIVYEIDSNKYDSAFFDYVIKGASGVRSGNVYSAWSGSSVTWSEYSNVDIGDTSDVSLYLNENNGLIRFIVSANTSNWIIKTIIRSI
jgi:hypothetical protein